MDENGVIPGAETNEDAAELAMQWEKPFIALIKALQKSKAIGDFGLAFRTSAGGRLYLYALAAAGQAGVERALGQYKAELERDMKLMGCTKISDLSRKNLRFRV